MQFADINADMFTDIITVDRSRQRLIIHIFDATTSNYTQKTSFAVHDCRTIQNVAVGRSDRTLRLFITCEDLAKKTIVKMYDRNMNGELSQAPPEKRNLQVAPENDATGSPEAADGGSTPQKIVDKILKENHMVFKAGGNIKSIQFQEVPQILYLTKGSQPFVGDINGDYYDDVIFNNMDAKGPGGKLDVAIFNPETKKYDIGNFKDKMVDPNCGGLASPLAAAELTTPHSVSLVDFDGDCLSDLFLTVQDPE